MMGDRSNWPPFYREPLGDNRTPFRHALLKALRAKHHLDELATAARILPYATPCLFVVGAGKDRLKLTYIPQEMPLQFSATLGDVIHNLRAVFDYVAVSLTSAPIGQGDPDAAYFPTGKDFAAYTAAKHLKMKGAHPDGLILIDRLEPWTGGIAKLRELHELDIQDKHKLLVPSIASTRISNLRVDTPDKTIELTQADFLPVDGGSNFVAQVSCPGIASTDEVRLGGQFTAEFEVVFERDQPLAGLPIVSTLSSVHAAALDLIQACEKQFNGYVSWATIHRT